jgi:hypothetical protein
VSNYNNPWLNSLAQQAASPVATGITPLAPGLFVTPQDYGAKADGQTDDTAAIQNAISGVPVGGILFLPAGTYLTSVPVRAKAPIRIEGNGACIKLTAASDCVMEIDYTGYSGGYLYTNGCGISNVILDVGGYAVDGLSLKGTIDCDFRNIRVKNITGAGVRLHTAQTCLFTNIDVSPNVGDWMHGIYPTNGILLDGSPNSNNTFVNSNIDQCSGSGIWLKSAINTLILNGTYEACYVGIEIGDASGYDCYANVAVGVDLESNVWCDIQMNATAFVNSIIAPEASSSGGLRVASGAYCNSVHGGWFDHFVFLAGSHDNHLHGMSVQSNNTDAGDRNTWSGLTSTASGGKTFPDKVLMLPSAPPWFKGGIYFDSTLNKLRVGGAAGWETVTSI